MGSYCIYEPLEYKLCYLFLSHAQLLNTTLTTSQINILSTHLYKYRQWLRTIYNYMNHLTPPEDALFLTEEEIKRYYHVTPSNQMKEMNIVYLLNSSCSISSSEDTDIYLAYTHNATLDLFDSVLSFLYLFPSEYTFISKESSAPITSNELSTTCSSILYFIQTVYFNYVDFFISYLRTNKHYRLIFNKTKANQISFDYQLHHTFTTERNPLYELISPQYITPYDFLSILYQQLCRHTDRCLYETVLTELLISTQFSLYYNHYLLSSMIHSSFIHENQTISIQPLCCIEVYP